MKQKLPTEKRSLILLKPDKRVTVVMANIYKGRENKKAKQLKKEAKKKEK